MAADRAGTTRGHEPPLYLQVADGSIDRFGEQIQIQTPDPSGWPGYPEQVGAARHAAGCSHAVTTGIASVAGQRCVIVGFDFSFLGGSAGVAGLLRLTPDDLASRGIVRGTIRAPAGGQSC